MSRNLGETNCKFCGRTVVLTEEPRPITREEGGVHYGARDGYSFEGMIVAKARCTACEAPYLAWVSLKACQGYNRTWRADEVGERGFFDLSHYHSFNDEPAVEDMPKFQIEDTYVRRPWPTCSVCGRPWNHWDDKRCGNWNPTGLHQGEWCEGGKKVCPPVVDAADLLALELEAARARATRAEVALAKIRNVLSESP